MGKFEAAVEKYKEALRLKPGFGSAVRISYIYALQENYGAAMKWIDDYIATSPARGMESAGWQLKAIYHYLFGNVRTALEDLDKGFISFDLEDLAVTNRAVSQLDFDNVGVPGVIDQLDYHQRPRDIRNRLIFF
jgi:tetratricopeptide (TPR) repeat protein